MSMEPGVAGGPAAALCGTAHGMYTGTGPAEQLREDPMSP